MCLIAEKKAGVLTADHGLVLALVSGTSGKLPAVAMLNRKDFYD